MNPFFSRNILKTRVSAPWPPKSQTDHHLLSKSCFELLPTRGEERGSRSSASRLSSSCRAFSAASVAPAGYLYQGESRSVVKICLRSSQCSGSGLVNTRSVSSPLVSQSLSCAASLTIASSAVVVVSSIAAVYSLSRRGYTPGPLCL